jgi:hypothetical protein
MAGVYADNGPLVIDEAGGQRRFSWKNLFGRGAAPRIPSHTTPAAPLVAEAPEAAIAPPAAPAAVAPAATEPPPNAWANLAMSKVKNFGVEPAVAAPAVAPAAVAPAPAVAGISDEARINNLRLQNAAMDQEFRFGNASREAAAINQQAVSLIKQGSLGGLVQARALLAAGQNANTIAQMHATADPSRPFAQAGTTDMLRNESTNRVTAADVTGRAGVKAHEVAGAAQIEAQRIHGDAAVKAAGITGEATFRAALAKQVAENNISNKDLLKESESAANEITKLLANDPTYLALKTEKDKDAYVERVKKAARLGTLRSAAVIAQ